jgi:hypothetical protein
MKPKTIDYLGMIGEGETKAQALTQAQRKIRDALSQDYTPRLIEWRGERVLCWQTPYGPCFSALFATGVVSCVTQYAPETRFDTVLSHARLHLAQETWDGEEEVSPLLDGRENGRFTEWTRYQKRYRALAAAGHQDAACRAYADVDQPLND